MNCFRFFQNHLRGILIVAIASVLAGCTTLKMATGWGYEKPQISIADVSVADASWQAVQVKISLAIENSNAYPLRIRDLAYEAGVSDSAFAKGQHPGVIEAKPTSTTAVSLPLKVNTQAAMSLLPALMKEPRSKLKFRVRAKVITELGDWPIEWVD